MPLYSDSEPELANAPDASDAPVESPHALTPDHVSGRDERDQHVSSMLAPGARPGVHGPLPWLGIRATSRLPRNL